MGWGDEDVMEQLETWVIIIGFHAVMASLFIGLMGLMIWLGVTYGY